MPKKAKPNPTVKMIDEATGEIEWSGTLDELLKANRDSLGKRELAELEKLRTHSGRVHVGGGAAPEFIIRR